jgi:hypothetical protein
LIFKQIEFLTCPWRLRVLAENCLVGLNFMGFQFFESLAVDLPVRL